MKKFSIFIVSALLAATISAKAQSVTLRISANYDVSIDDRYYENNEAVPALSSGTHSVKVYEVRPGFLGIGKKRTFVSSSNFELRNNDILIEVNQNGQLRINESGNNNTTGQNRDRNNDGDGNNGYQKKNGKGYGPYNNPGRGNKYGLYKKDHDKKNKKVKKAKKEKNEDNEDDDD